MRMLFSSQTAPEVGLLKGLLEEAGIPCEVRNEATYANLPGAAFQPEIWVLNDTDYERACEVRDGWRQSIPTQASERPQEESPVAALRFIGFVCLAALGFMIWQAFRADDWVGPVVGGAVFGFLAVVFFVAAGQLHPWRRSRTGKRS
jgi:hypothetical protein